MRHDLFPTPLWHIEGAPEELLNELYEKGKLIKEKNLYQVTEDHTPSNQGGYQTAQFNWEDFHPAGREYIENVLNNIFSSKNQDQYSQHITGNRYATCNSTLTVNITSWWYNINPQGAWNVPHNHAGTDYALVFFVTDSDCLLRFLTPYNSRRNEPDHCSMNAKKGDILIFPADIVHYVIPNQREEDRISISMNVYVDNR